MLYQDSMDVDDRRFIVLISTKGRYALTVMMDLAKYKDDGYIPLKDIAQRQELSQKYLEAIFKPLSDKGFVIGMRGKNGGYRLARRAEDISILDVLEITEGGVEPVTSLDPSKAKGNDELIIWLWQGLHDTIKDYLSSKTLACLLEGKSSEEQEPILAVL